MAGADIVAHVVQTDFGDFYTSFQTSERLHRADKVVRERYVAKVCSHCRDRWVAGEPYPYRSKVSFRALNARILNSLKTTGGNNAVR